MVPMTACARSTPRQRPASELAGQGRDVPPPAGQKSLMPGNAWASGVAVLLISASSACAGPSAGSQVIRGGPLSIGSTPGELCVRQSDTGQYTNGFDLINNRGSEMATLGKFSMVGAGGLNLSGVFTATIANETLIGVQSHWPPTHLDIGELTEASPETGLGAGESLNLVLHLADDSASGQSAPRRYLALRPTYTVGDQLFVVTGRSRCKVPC
jgi:hypothetical protein